MGKKGDKLTQASVEATEKLLKDLNSIKGVTSKKMFGGHGIFHEKKMFGLIDSKGQSFLKADDSTIADYEKANSTKHSRMPYYSIPEDVISNKEKLQAWVKKAIAISK